jgi:hypothetical protein
VYFYMEGMVAPMATFRNYGHRPAALEVVNRSLREKDPGAYGTTVRLPVAGKYDVAFLLHSPSLIHCFDTEVKPNPEIARTGPPLEVEYLVKERRVPAGEPLKLTFRLTDRDFRKPRTGLDDVRLLYYLAPGRQKMVAQAIEIGDGIYEAELSISEAGAYYVYLAVPSAKIEYGDLTFLSLIAEGKAGRAGSPRKP